MNRKVLVIAVALMAVAMLATPLFGTVSACGHRGRCEKQIEKIPVLIGPPMSTPPPPPPVSSPPEVKVCGNVQIGRGGTTYYSKYGVSKVGVGPWLIGGSSLWTLNYIIYLKNMTFGKGIVQYHVVITFPSETYVGDPIPEGTFEGTVTLLGEFKLYGSATPPQPLPWHWNGYRYGVLRGDGDFEGWKLVISGKTTDGLFDPEMYMFKPV
jgi:hypothetical protein